MSEDTGTLKSGGLLLLISVFVVATCGLIYELIAGTIASYLLGDSIRQFSFVIGFYLFSMGIGSYLSKYFVKNLLSWFIQIEILVGAIGGVSSTVLFVSFEHIHHFNLLLYFFISLTGILVGLEIPLLMRILKDKFQFQDLLSRVFAFDYLGALIASVLFPLLMVPYLGLLRTSYFFGILNLLVAIVAIFKFKDEQVNSNFLKFEAFLILAFLIFGFILSNKIQSFAEGSAFNENVIYTKSSPYQRIVITRDKSVTKLYLNGNLQFSSMDEYRYHEALVHPAMTHLKKHTNVLILGGGDGLALREVLKYPDIRDVTMVDLDSSVTTLFKKSTLLNGLNKQSLFSSKLKLITADAFSWIKENQKKFDFIIVDFPDPTNFSIGKLYSNTFYREVGKALSDSGVIVVQSTSPYVARKSFWCVNETIHSIGLTTKPYHIYVPSFGEWGFVLAYRHWNPQVNYVPEKLKYIDSLSMHEMFQFPMDMSKVPVEINRLNNQILIHYFEDEWAKVM